MCVPSEGQGEDKARFPQASRQPALSMHLKRRRIHFRVLKLNPGGEEPRHAKQSISFSADSYITDPPFPPDRMTYVIYHMGLGQTTARGGKPSCPLLLQYSTVWLALGALLIWCERQRVERGEVGRGEAPACPVYGCLQDVCCAVRVQDWPRYQRCCVPLYDQPSRTAQLPTLDDFPVLPVSPLSLSSLSVTSL